MKTFPRLVTALVLLLGTGGYLQVRAHSENVPEHLALKTFPARLDAWNGTDIAIDKGTAEVLGPGDFLLRQYANPDSDEPPVYLFVAYFPTQRTGDTMHSPQNCLPGAGWEPLGKQTVNLHFGSSSPFPANLYVVEKGLSKQLVLYWYESQGRAVASEYRAKINLVVDAIRTNRSDGALIRLSTPALPDESEDAALERLKSFANVAVPQLDGYIPR
jgi:EpsI family protein